MADLLDMTERTVEVTLAGEEYTATQLFIDDWIELSKQGFTLETVAKTVDQVTAEGKNAYEFRKLIVWRGIRCNYPEYEDGLPDGLKVSLLEMSIAARAILALENLAVPGQEEVITEGTPEDEH